MIDMQPMTIDSAVEVAKTSSDPLLSNALAIGETIFEFLAGDGPCWTVYRDGTPVAVGGIRLNKPARIGQPWIVLSADGRRYVKGIYRQVQWMLSEGARELGMTRLETTANPKWPGVANWLRHLGFRKIGTEQRPDYPDIVLDVYVKEVA